MQTMATALEMKKLEFANENNRARVALSEMLPMSGTDITTPAARKA